ncbi:hypothetical protein FD06_GL000169 [Apilactobacillus ozensis DSM 23829 = JCM 17196]|uniref:Acyl carrier protein n=1 Tax=Apilactobacillus ozensis DSM 23829 = JCM 17196 TaxID=1423781 RepID=A0A0R2AXV5_9LACO|nr:acyl carrier protein [Apilactobacillus ozensis]KRM68051.1 hypothetical protein FD06_GL000169 [Apilactobacillus ozensis DSM 23829 = JCM 17196]
MTKEEVLTKICDMVADQFSVNRDKVNGKLNFQNDLDADSIDFVEFVLSLENEFGAEISDEAAEKIQTIDEAADFVIANADNK